MINSSFNYEKNATTRGLEAILVERRRVFKELYLEMRCLAAGDDVRELRELRELRAV